MPFLSFPRNPSAFPFPSTFAGHELCKWGYSKFDKAAQNNEFGKHFVWCGDAFDQATSIMYADSIHYSREGAKILAKSIIQKAMTKGLLAKFIE